MLGGSFFGTEPVTSGDIEVRFLFNSTTGVKSDMVAKVLFSENIRYISGVAKGAMAGHDYSQSMETYLVAEEHGFKQYFKDGEGWTCKQTAGGDTMDVSNLFTLDVSKFIQLDEVTSDDTECDKYIGTMSYDILRELMGSTANDIPSKADLGLLDVEIYVSRGTGRLVSFDASIQASVEDVTCFKFGFTVHSLNSTMISLPEV